MKKFTLLMSFLALISITNGASSQTAEQLILLQNNPALSGENKLQINNQRTLRTSAGGIPLSQGPKEPNADDTLIDPSLVTQVLAPTNPESSVTQQYYRVLSGEILPIYGLTEFSQKQEQNLLFFNTVGKNYLLAAGDLIRVTIRGRTESDALYKIGRDGQLILPGLPPVLVSGSTVTEIEEKLLDSLRLDDAAAAVFISLETARLITVQVSGAVSNPRTIAVPAYTPLSRVLAYAGGILPSGSLRTISLQDRDGNTQSIDFYDFLKSTTRSNDPLIADASRIFVGDQGQTIAAVGLVARPGIFELKDGSRNISVSELLKLTGTSIIPPGAELEVLFIDDDGITSKRKIDRSGFIEAGEVLDVRFVETNLQGSIEVSGAVLNEFKIATTKPLALKKILKNGRILKNNTNADKGNAVLDFALLISNSGETRAISLRDKIQDPAFSVAPDTKLLVLDASDYRRILDENSNTTDDPLNAAIEQSDRVELFLNGKRIAFIPPTQGKTFSDILKRHYRFGPEISLDLAIIESAIGEARSTSLRSLLGSNKPVSLLAGEKYHLFETSFLKSNFEKSNKINEPYNSNKINEPYNSNKINEPYNSNRFDTSNDTHRFDTTQTQTTTSVFDWTVLKRLFARANVIQIKLDDEIRGFLPEDTKLLATAAADMLLFDNFGNHSDFALIEFRDTSNQISYASASIIAQTSKPLEGKPVVIHLFRPETLKDFINDRNSDLLSKIEDTSVALYKNFELITFGIGEDLKLKSSQLSREINDASVYPLFALHTNKTGMENYWKNNVISISDLKNQKFIDNIKVKDKIQIFTNQFIRDLSSRGIIGATDNKNTVSDIKNETLPADGLDKKGNADPIQGNPLTQRKEINELDRFELNEKIKLINSHARFIGGSVGTPGSYPAANTISLAQLIAVAGGLTADANTHKIAVSKLKIEKGRILPDKVEEVDLTMTPSTQVILSGMYNVTIPPFINDASTGVVTLAGQIERPGQYVIGRDETLHNLIDRAGGFTSVAYPLGAIFTRENLKAAQKEGNDLLARQVEEAILKISQSENKQGVGEQITAVLGYAKQLRQQEVSGRLTVNVLQKDKSAPVYLQNGDILTIPKRPGHVSVIGSVQKNTIASYSEGKRLSSYLASAGGTNSIADRSLIYIVLPNGESDSVTNDSIIPPGSVIVVPPKTHSLSPLNFTETVSRILGNIALSFLAINNAR